MTREEAIDFLECRRGYYASLSTDPSLDVKATKVCGYTLAESANACLMAIEALEHESGDDCISRKAALWCCRNEWEKEVEMRLKSLPPVTPQPKAGHWICCHCGQRLKWFDED